jgi:hypothetical protein
MYQLGDTSISARDLNRCLEAAEAYHRSHALGMGRGALAAAANNNLIRVKNSSGADRKAGEVLEFTGLVVDSSSLAAGAIWLNGDKPALRNGCGVLAQPVGSGAIGACYVAGACLALVNVTSTDHRYAAVKSDQYVLESGTAGEARILWKPSGTGPNRLCAVLLGTRVDRAYIHASTGNTTQSVSNGAWLQLYQPFAPSHAANVEVDTPYLKATVGGYYAWTFAGRVKAQSGDPGDEKYVSLEPYRLEEDRTTSHLLPGRGEARVRVFKDRDDNTIIPHGTLVAEVIALLAAGEYFGLKSASDATMTVYPGHLTMHLVGPP